MRFDFFSKKEIDLIPSSCGVYCFKGKRRIFYIGKSKNLKQRIKNHFNSLSFKNFHFLKKTEKIGVILTDNEWSALLLESKLIKKYKPPFNIIWKDDKNYFFVCITKEEFPRVFITHQKKEKNALYFGPFVEGRALKKVLFFLRRIFPFYFQKKHPPQKCSWCYLGYCPGPFPDKKEYQKNIRSIISFFQGKAGNLLERMEKEMFALAKKEDFEKAQKVKEQIFNLKKVLLNIHLIYEENEDKWQRIKSDLQEFFQIKSDFKRIEAFDISNIQGKEAVGSMVVFENGRPSFKDYRKFKIKGKEEPNDILMTREILERRFSHSEWPFPDLVVLDGGKAHLNLGQILKKENPNLKKIIFVSFAKESQRLFSENKKNSIPIKKLKPTISYLIFKINKESHRFALSYHQKLKKKKLFTKN